MYSPMWSPRLYPTDWKNGVRRSLALMGTGVTIHVVGREADPQEASRREEAIERAFEWFSRVEECCTRFDTSSELMQLTTHVGVPIQVSTILYEAVQFALGVAEESEGAFDPTVGYAMETRGFNREHRTSETIQTAIDPDTSVSYLHVRLDPDRVTITLRHPLILDLGAVAKGLAVDLAARELRSFRNFAINAGGDLFLGGWNPDGAPLSIGIHHPPQEEQFVHFLRASHRAVFTSMDYERGNS